jgi:uncharacterized protein
LDFRSVIKSVDTRTVEILLWVQPGASKTTIVGIHPLDPPALKIKIKAPPVEGKANEEVLSFFAKTFGVPIRQIALVSGETQRLKRIQIKGVGLDEILPLLISKTKD